MRRELSLYRLLPVGHATKSLSPGNMSRYRDRVAPSLKRVSAVVGRVHSRNIHSGPFLQLPHDPRPRRSDISRPVDLIRGVASVKNVRRRAKLQSKAGLTVIVPTSCTRRRDASGEAPQDAGRSTATSPEWQLGPAHLPTTIASPGLPGSLPGTGNLSTLMQSFRPSAPLPSHETIVAAATDALSEETDTRWGREPRT
jgi:hypothetical protein